MLEITLNNEKTVTLTSSREGIFIDGLPAAHELVKNTETSFKLIGEKTIFDVEVVAQDGKELTLSINNQVITLKITDHIDQVLEKLGMYSAQSNLVKEIKAPMPGAILDVLVKVGDQVQANDQLIVLEAMKMENVIKSPGEGVVGKIHVETKENVEKNQVLISFE